jgi:hypothetical protein
MQREGKMSKIIKISDIAWRNFANELEPGKLTQSRSSPSVLVVSTEKPALEVASEADRRQSSLILIVNEGGAICGIVAPRTVATKIGIHLGLSPMSLHGTLAYYQQSKPDQALDFQHEWLIQERIALNWCVDGDHYTDYNPCKDHPGSQVIAQAARP